MSMTGFERQNRWWSPEEREHLRARYGKVCRKIIARELLRSERAVKAQIERLALERIEWPIR